MIAPHFTVLSGYSGRDKLKGGADEDKLVGGNGYDNLIGNTGDDILKGGRSNDKLYGGSGDDVLKGGSGKDLLKGGKGDDVLRGGSGADKFIFDKGQDIIRDFKDDVDTIAVNRFVISGTGSTVDDLLEMGEIVNGNAVFDLSGPHQLTVQSVTDLENLRNDLIIG